MWWDVASVASIGAALAVRWHWGDRRGGALLAMLSSVLSTRSAYRRRWARRAESED